MCSIIALLLFFFAGLFGFGISGTTTVEPPAEVVSPQVLSCASAASEGTNVDNLLALVDDTFVAGDWTQEVETYTEKTTATWLSNNLGAVAYLEYLHYDCGVSEEQLKAFYSAEGFQTLFENYTSYEPTVSCAEDDTRLFEFNAVNNDYDYSVLYWVKPLTPTRAMTLMVVVPQNNPAALAELAGQLFPELPTCAAAAA